jgi:hypothetical protein
MGTRDCGGTVTFRNRRNILAQGSKLYSILVQPIPAYMSLYGIELGSVTLKINNQQRDWSGYAALLAHAE